MGRNYPRKRNEKDENQVHPQRRGPRSGSWKSKSNMTSRHANLFEDRRLHETNPPRSMEFEASKRVASFQAAMHECGTALRPRSPYRMARRASWTGNGVESSRRAAHSPEI